MPKYFYKCDVCSDEFSMWHSMTEPKTDCPDDVCRTKNSLVRIPSLTTVIIKTSQEDGKKVDEFIEDSKKELQEFKEDLTDRRGQWK